MIITRRFSEESVKVTIDQYDSESKWFVKSYEVLLENGQSLLFPGPEDKQWESSDQAMEAGFTCAKSVRDAVN